MHAYNKYRKPTFISLVAYVLSSDTSVLTRLLPERASIGLSLPLSLSRCHISSLAYIHPNPQLLRSPVLRSDLKTCLSTSSIVIISRSQAFMQFSSETTLKLRSAPSTFPSQLIDCLLYSLAVPHLL